MLSILYTSLLITQLFSRIPILKFEPIRAASIFNRRIVNRAADRRYQARNRTIPNSKSIAECFFLLLIFSKLFYVPIQIWLEDVENVHSFMFILWSFTLFSCCQGYLCYNMIKVGHQPSLVDELHKELQKYDIKHGQEVWDSY